MRCKSCDYRLWNLASRRCPECGTAFLPSDFEFIPNSVRFCCQHCNQDYYGVGANGHLDPIAFDCAKCGKPVHMDEMVLLPTEGIQEEQTFVNACPWLERRKRGRLTAWFATIGMAMVSPVRLIRSLPGEVRTGQAWWFAVVTGLTAWTMGIGFFGLIGLALPLFMRGGPGGGGQGGASVPAVIGGALLGIAIVALATALVLVVLLFLWSAVTHGVLRLSGDIKGPMARTSQALCYASGAGVLTAIPCLGIYFGWIWPIISGVLMVKEAQEVRGWRAALAVTTFPALCIFVVIGAYAALIAFGLTMAGTGAASQSQQTLNMSMAVAAFARDHEGRGPAHAIELAQFGYLTVDDFVSMQSATSVDLVPVGTSTLDAFLTLDEIGRQGCVDDAIDALPDNVVAHRLGDYVFTYHGIDMQNADGSLWLVVASPDPDQNSARGSSETVIVGLAGGILQLVPVSEMSRWLTAQNTLRARFSLPPLPDPSTVTHDQPATASPDE